MAEQQFVTIVFYFANMCWHALGKVPNPATGKVEPHIAAAREIIELLETLQAKTKGNLTEEEDRVLSSTIADLQLNYVDEAAKAEKAEKEKPATPPAEGKVEADAKAEEPAG